MLPRKIHCLHRSPIRPSKKPPLLFIHGGYVHAGCWDRHFLPFFAAHGYDCHALDLSGHGASEGRDHLDRFGLDDYLEDVTQVIDALDRKAIVIGHSMGSAIAEDLLVKRPVEAAILLSPVPTIGTSGAILRLATSRPQFFHEVSHLSQLEITADNLQLMRDIYFSPQMPVQQLLDFTSLIQEESQRAVTELALLGWKFEPLRPHLPMLVLGGEVDALFPPELLAFVARRWHADLQIIPDLGHVLMLDIKWETAAQALLAWLQKKGY